MEEQTKNSESAVIESPHSVKVAINAKGQWSAEIKCYGQTPQEAKERTLSLSADMEALISAKNKGAE